MSEDSDQDQLIVSASEDPDDYEETNSELWPPRRGRDYDSMRRFTQLTNAFSKKLENLQTAVALHFAHYNLVRLHKTLPVTPAMPAGVTDRLRSIEELVDRTSN